MSRPKKQPYVNHERWMVSYADFVTLLFAFFVVMFASSRQDHKKTQQAETSIRTAFQTMGVFPDATLRPISGTVVMIASKTDTRAALGGDTELPGVIEDLHKLKRQMEQALAPQIANGTVAISVGHGGLLISLRDVGFFESGSAVPRTSSIPILNKIGKGIATAPYDVRIEGHTDDVPIQNSQYASNWELSTARATVLTRFFIERDQILPNRLSAAGYAQYHPIASNLTAEGRSRNRRVDIIVLPTREQAVMMENLLAEHNPVAPSFSAEQNRPRLQGVLLRAKNLKDEWRVFGRRTSVTSK